MTRLGELFTVRRRFFRSVHLATDAWRADACEGYVLTPLGKATLGRVLDGMEPGRAERAWSLTGPYGTGKSAFVVLLAQLLAAVSEDGTRRAIDEVRAGDVGLGGRVRRRRASGKGMLPVLVSGTYGPLIPPLLDAVERAVRETLRASARREALLGEVASARRSRAKGADLNRRVVKVFESLCALACDRGGDGVLLIVDELGKTLEYAARGPGDADEVFLLQELAEAASRSGARPMVLVTLLHQSFDRYAKSLSAETRAEWSKVQGRFEDVAFVDAPGELLRLAARSLSRVSDRDPSAFAPWDARADRAVALGMAPPEQRDLLAQLAPLHPTVALLLPSLCRGPLAQNERSLFGFLTSTADGAFGAFLAESADGAPTYTLDRLYDHLAATLGPAQYTHAAGRRWAAIDEALARLPTDEPAASARVLKAVGLLTLLGSRAVRASREGLAFALDDGRDDPSEVHQAIDRLAAASHLVYRRHSDAYALWEGSDIDLDAHFDDARRRAPGFDEVSTLLRERMVLRPWVARRHFFETGTLRHFDLSLRGAGGAREAEGDAGADGRIVYLVPEADESHDDLVAAATAAERSESVVYGVPRDASELLSSVGEWFAWDSVRGRVGALAGDPVARRELAARIHFASDRLEAAVQSCFGLLDGARVDWVYDGELRRWSGARELSRALSSVCDRAYPRSPVLRNELINRRALSSAAAAARRALIDAMVAKAGEARLGIEGAPPELSMYASFLAAGGLHRERGGVVGFGPPPDDDPLRLRPAWDRVESFLDETEGGAQPLRALYDALRAAPVGMRDGPMPVLLFAVLLASPGEVALFEDGSFVPELSSATVERLLRQPGRFTLARYRVDEGRRAVLNAVASAIGIAGEPTPVGLARDVVRRVGQLPRYARNTRSVSPSALATRDAVLAARDPLKLVFDDLPKALGLPSVERGAAVDAAAFATSLASALGELSSAHRALLATVERKVAEALAVSGDGAFLRAELASRAKRIQGIATDLRLRAFLGRAVFAEGTHAEWLEGIAMVVGNRPPSEWTDGEMARFELGLAEVTAMFERAELLAGPRSGAVLRADDPRAVEVAERDILRLLEGRFGAQRDAWRRALERALDAAKEPTEVAE
ncbi:MAG: hypothetical protein R3A52_04375 [Polyangiales bacterium]